VAAEVKEWLQQNKLESVGGALLQLGVESLEHLYMIEEQVSTKPTYTSTGVSRE
jgi:hypothetical protein